MRTEPAPDIASRIEDIVHKLGMAHIDSSRIVCMRSRGSKSRATARIWSLPKIWQKALNVRAHYVIEVLVERFDGLSKDEQDRTLLHELAHIPKSFSGALVAHRTLQWDSSGELRLRKIGAQEIERMFRQYRARC